MDPRIERTRAAVMRAATDLMVEGGPAALTVDAVVARSGVAKSTIYRHWPSRDDLLAAVVAANVPRLPTPSADTSTEAGLREVMRYSASALRTTDWARMLPAFIMLMSHDEDVKAVGDRVELDGNAVLAALVERAASEGLIRPDVDVGEAVAHLQGPLMLAHLGRLASTDDRFADAIVDRFLAAFQPSAARSSR